jgi:hypothetical protein
MTGKGETAVGRSRHFPILIANKRPSDTAPAPSCFTVAMVYVWCVLWQAGTRFQIQLPAMSAI